ncbi:hypothetical protein B0H17DRAFT_1179104 [Mycena rosella]|uniref:Uncharacterized protein n=1 Tax=Mycena rosella TaxID=1033263 RepID=A0AAD7DMF8_MYCRO|nr:hypothetical protein B0H17DRAFT_1179104 [Mycena rosella]
MSRTDDTRRGAGTLFEASQLPADGKDGAAAAPTFDTWGGRRMHAMRMPDHRERLVGKRRRGAGRALLGKRRLAGPGHDSGVRGDERADESPEEEGGAWEHDTPRASEKKAKRKALYNHTPPPPPSASSPRVSGADRLIATHSLSQLQEQEGGGGARALRTGTCAAKAGVPENEVMDTTRSQHTLE